jgi:hypothetical protein
VALHSNRFRDDKLGIAKTQFYVFVCIGYGAKWRHTPLGVAIASRQYAPPS